MSIFIYGIIGYLLIGAILSYRLVEFAEKEKIYDKDAVKVAVLVLMLVWPLIVIERIIYHGTHKK